MARWYISTTAAACTAHFKKELWAKGNEQAQHGNNCAANNTFFHVRSFDMLKKSKRYNVVFQHHISLAE
jgi:hypothetical protein